MTREEKLSLLKQVKAGSITREKLLHINELQVVEYGPCSEDEELDLEQWVNDMGFLIIDKHRKEILAPCELSDEQWAKMCPEGRSTTNELLEYLESINQ